MFVQFQVQCVNLYRCVGVNCAVFVQVAAQVGHAAVGLYQALQEKNSWREMAWKWDHGGYDQHSIVYS